MGSDLLFASSNEFEVKDVAAFEKWAAELEIEVDRCGGNSVRIFRDNAVWPMERETSSAGSEEIDIAEEVRHHLDEKSVAILTEWYINDDSSASGVAINAQGIMRESYFPADLERLAEGLAEAGQ